MTPSPLLLAQAYRQEACVTSDHPYYGGAAMQLLETVLQAETESFVALCYKASLCLRQHHFAQGLTVAKCAQRIDSKNAHMKLDHYADRELAYAYFQTNELDQALEHAKIGYDETTIRCAMNSPEGTRLAARAAGPRGPVPPALPAPPGLGSSP
jgi:hypothetical protein